MADTEFKGELTSASRIANPSFGLTVRITASSVPSVENRDMTVIDYLIHGNGAVCDKPVTPVKTVIPVFTAKHTFVKSEPVTVKITNGITVRDMTTGNDIVYPPRFVETFDWIADDVPVNAFVSKRVNSPFFGLSPIESINARLDYIGGDFDHSTDDDDDDDRTDELLYGVDFIDETDVETEHALAMTAYKNRLLAASARVDEFARSHKLTGRIGWSYEMKRAMTAAGMMDGNDALNTYGMTPLAFAVDDTIAAVCNEHYTVDEMNALSIRSIYDDDFTVMDNDMTGRNHYHFNHWLTGESVESIPAAPVVTVYGAAVLNLSNPMPIRRGVNSKFPIANARSYVYNTDGFEWNLSFSDAGHIGYAGFYFTVPNMKTHALTNTGKWIHRNVKHAVKMTADIERVVAVLTNEPMLSRDIAALTGFNERKIGKMMKTAASAGIVKSVTIKNKSTEFHPRAAFFL